jgi:hypothetical protein
MHGRMRTMDEASHCDSRCFFTLGSSTSCACDVMACEASPFFLAKDRRRAAAREDCEAERGEDMLTVGARTPSRRYESATAQCGVAVGVKHDRTRRVQTVVVGTCNTAFVLLALAMCLPEVAEQSTAPVVGQRLRLERAYPLEVLASSSHLSSNHAGSSPTTGACLKRCQSAKVCEHMMAAWVLTV